jgi:hypothetical protein
VDPVPDSLLLRNTATLGLEPVGYGGVLLSTPLHAFNSFTPFAKCT